MTASDDRNTPGWREFIAEGAETATL